MLFNQITVAGRLGRDPEMSYTPNGKAVTKFSIAVDQGKDQPTMWLNVTTWDKLAEFVERYARKGMQVFVQGKLQQSTYKDKHGVSRTSVEVIAGNVQLLEKRKDEANDGDIPDEVLPPE